MILLALPNVLTVPIGFSSSKVNRSSTVTLVVFAERPVSLNSANLVTPSLPAGTWQVAFCGPATKQENIALIGRALRSDSRPGVSSGIVGPLPGLAAWSWSVVDTFGCCWLIWPWLVDDALSSICRLRVVLAAVYWRVCVNSCAKSARPDHSPYVTTHAISASAEY